MHFPGEPDLQQLFVGVGEDLDSAWPFMSTFELRWPCVPDEAELLYDSYGAGPSVDSGVRVPVHVVVDREGIITYYSQEADLVALRAAIEDALRE